MSDEKLVDTPFSEMDILDALKFMEEGTDDPEDNEIINRAIKEIKELREEVKELRSEAFQVRMDRHDEDRR